MIQGTEKILFNGVSKEGAKAAAHHTITLLDSSPAPFPPSAPLSIPAL